MVNAKKLKKGKKTFIRSVFRLRLDGYGASLYEFNNGEAIISFDRNTYDMYKNSIFFSSLQEAEKYIEDLEDMDCSDAQKLKILLQRAGIFKDDEE
jgi:hypothetical protein